MEETNATLWGSKEEEDETGSLEVEATTIKVTPRPLTSAPRSR